MKKATAFLLAMVLLLGCALVGLAGCAAPAAGVKLGILAPAVTHGWVAAVGYNAERRCAELKKDGTIQDYRLETSQDAVEMSEQLKALVEWGATAIVAFPQWEGMEAPIQQAIDGGITVVSFDIAIDAAGAYRVAGDNEAMGVEAARYIIDKAGADASVVMLEVPTSGSVSELRRKGFIETAAVEAPGMDIIIYASQFSREAGERDMADILKANHSIDAVFAMDDETAIGALAAIEAAGRTDIKVIAGGGGCQEYFGMMPQYTDIWLQSSLYSPAMVRDAVDVAVAVQQGEQVEQVTIIPTEVVDRDNYTTYLDADSPY